MRVAIVIIPPGALHLALLRIAHCGRQRIDAGRRFSRVHGVHAFQRNVNRTIDRCAGTGEYSHHVKGMIPVEREGHVTDLVVLLDTPVPGAPDPDDDQASWNALVHTVRRRGDVTRE